MGFAGQYRFGTIHGLLRGWDLVCWTWAGAGPNPKPNICNCSSVFEKTDNLRKHIDRGGRASWNGL